MIKAYYGFDFLKKKNQSLSCVENTLKQGTCQLWLVDISIGKHENQGLFQWLTVLLIMMFSRDEN